MGEFEVRKLGIIETCEFDSIIKDYYDINLSATDLCNYIDSFKFLCDKFNIVEFDDCWYLYHKTN